MPSLRLLGRRSLMGGDDIQLLVKVSFAFRLIQFILSFPLLLHLSVQPDLYEDYLRGIAVCEDFLVEFQDEITASYWGVFSAWEILISFLSVSVVLSIAGLAIATSMHIVASRGAPTDVDARKSLPKLCYAHLLVFSVLRILAFVYGVAALTATYKYCYCSDWDGSDDVVVPDGSGNNDAIQGIQSQCLNYPSRWIAFLVGSVVCHFIDVIYAMVFSCIFIYRRFPKLVTRFSFQSRIRFVCSCCFNCCNLLTCSAAESWQQEDMQTFATTITDLFDDNGILDVAPSDILAALYMMRLSHVHEEWKLRDVLLDFAKSKRPMEDLQALLEDDSEDDKSASTTGQEDDPKTRTTAARHISNMLDQLERGQSQLQIERGWDATRRVDQIKGWLRESAFSNILSIPLSLPLRPPSFKGKSSSKPQKNLRRLSMTFQPQGLHEDLAPVLRQTLDPTDPYERFLVAEGARYIWIAEAIYIWSVADTYDNSSTTHKTSKRNKKKKASLADRTVAVTIAATEKVATNVENELELMERWFRESDHTGRALATCPIYKLEEKDVIFAQYKEGIQARPYSIILDHEWRSVVVTIRGTQGLDDLLADLMMSPTELTTLGEKCGFDGAGRFAHAGILLTAEWLQNDIEHHGILDDLLLKPNSQYSHYRLRITGHSLGAGCAVLLSLLLRSKFPTVRCLAFSPPGCTVCARLAKESEQWVTTFVLDSDIVPRISIQALASFRDEVLETIARIRIPKCQVMANRSIDEKGSREELETFVRKALWDPPEIPLSAFYHQLKEFREYSETKSYRKKDTYLYAPGQLIQLTRNLDATSGGGDGTGNSSIELGSDEASRYNCAARWVEKEDFGRIALTTHFLSDHQTANVRIHIGHLAELYKLKQPYSSVLDETVEC